MTSDSDAPAPSVLAVLDELTKVASSARSVPMSSACMVNREQLLGLVDALRAGIPVQISQADQLRSSAQTELEVANAQAERIRDEARRDAEQIASRDAIADQARVQAKEIIRDAEAEAERLRRNADDYVVTRLSSFRDDLESLRGQVDRGIAVVERERGVDPADLDDRSERAEKTA